MLPSINTSKNSDIFKCLWAAD